MSASILNAQNLSKVVGSAEGKLTILHDLSLDLARGDSLAIVGSSGSGKSTLLGLLAGLDQPSGGEVRLAGHALGDLDEDQRARVRAAHVGFVFQSFQLLDSLDALENVMLPLGWKAAPTLASAPENCSSESASANAWATIRASSPAASSNGSPLPVPSRRSRTCCSPTNPPATSTAPPASGSATCSSNSTANAVPPWSWLPTTSVWRIAAGA